MNKKNSRLSDLTALLRYRPKHTEQDREHVCNFASTRTMLSSVLCMFICAICLCGATWAWFTSTASVDITTIVSSEWKPSITVTEQVSSDPNSAAIISEDGALQSAVPATNANGAVGGAGEENKEGEAKEEGTKEEATAEENTEEEAEKKTKEKEEGQSEQETEVKENSEGQATNGDGQQEQPSEEQKQGGTSVEPTLNAASDTTNAPVLMLLSTQVPNDVLQSDTNNVTPVTNDNGSEDDESNKSSLTSGSIGTEYNSENGVWQGVKYTGLDTSKAYIVALSVTGSRAGATGCFKIEAGSTTYYTNDLTLETLDDSNDVFGASLTLQVKNTSEMTITPVWGTLANRDDTKTIGETGDITTYTTSNQQETALAIANEIGDTAEGKGEEKKAEGEQTTTEPQQSDANANGTANGKAEGTSTENGTGTETGTGTGTTTSGDGASESAGTGGSTETKQETEIKSDTGSSDGTAEGSEDKSESTGTDSTESTGSGDKTDKTDDTDTAGSDVTDDSGKQGETVQQSETAEKEKSVEESSGSDGEKNNGNESSGSSDTGTDTKESEDSAAADSNPVEV